MIKLSAFNSIPQLIEMNSILLPKQLYPAVPESFTKFVDASMVYKIEDSRFVEAVLRK